MCVCTVNVFADADVRKDRKDNTAIVVIDL